MHSTVKHLLVAESKLQKLQELLRDIGALAQSTCTIDHIVLVIPKQNQLLHAALLSVSGLQLSEVGECS